MRFKEPFGTPSYFFLLTSLFVCVAVGLSCGDVMCSEKDTVKDSKAATPFFIFMFHFHVHCSFLA